MLKLSTKGRYGLRAMIDLAEAWGGGPVEMSAIARRQQLSRKYLHALLSSLKRAGLTEAVRGAKGGYKLSRPPEEIEVFDIFEALEGRLAVVNCVADDSFCDRSSNCATVGLWKQLNGAISDVLHNVTLKDLTEQDFDNLSECISREASA